MSLDQKPKVCLCCGKKLQKYTVCSRQDTDVPPSTYKNFPVLQVTKIYKFVGDRGYLLWLWLGDYGWEGNNYFCSKTCGFKYAVAQAKKSNSSKNV